MIKIFTVSLISCVLILLSSCGGETSSTSATPKETSVQFSTVSPTSASTNGGVLVTITGSNFDSSTTVLFGAAACTNITLISSIELTCTAPAATAGNVSITLSNADGTSDTEANAFVYGSVAPTFTSVSPNGYINSQSTTLTISGTGFVSGMTVTIGGQTCGSLTVNSGSQLSCSNPTGLAAGDYDVVVTNPSLDSATGSNAFAFRVAPSLSTLKAAGPQGAFQSCQGCHGGNGGLTISNFASLSARVVAGSPTTSLIWQRMMGMNGALMPQGGPMRPDTELDALSDWILDGAQDN